MKKKELLTDDDIFEFLLNANVGVMQIEESKTKSIARDLKDFKSKIKLIESGNHIGVILIAIHKDKSKNSIKSIAFTSGAKALTNAVYDAYNDAFSISCYEYFYIGEVFIGYNLVIEDCYKFNIDIPLPEVILKRYMTNTQKKSIDSWKSNFPEENYELQYLQVSF